MAEAMSAESGTVDPTADPVDIDGKGTESGHESEAEELAREKRAAAEQAAHEKALAAHKAFEESKAAAEHATTLTLEHLQKVLENFDFPIGDPEPPAETVAQLMSGEGETPEAQLGGDTSEQPVDQGGANNKTDNQANSPNHYDAVPDQPYASTSAANVEVNYGPMDAADTGDAGRKFRKMLLIGGSGALATVILGGIAVVVGMFATKKKEEKDSEEIPFEAVNSKPKAPSVEKTATPQNEITFDVWPKPNETASKDKASDPDGNDTLDKSSLRFKVSETDYATSYKVDSIGTWSYDKDKNLVTFTPEETFTNGSIAAQYVILDKQGNESEPATLTVIYGSAPSAPSIDKSSELFDPVSYNIWPDHTSDSNKASDPDGDNTLDKTYLKFLPHDDGNEKQSTQAAGVWSYNPGTFLVTFAPASGFKGGVVQANYIIRDTAGIESEPASLKLHYGADNVVISPQVYPLLADRKTTFTINVFSGDFGEKPSVGTSAIKPDVVYLTAMVKMPAEPAPPNAIVSSNKQEVFVEGQGYWRVGAGGTVTFTKLKDFHDDPSTIGYQIQDINGRLSNIAPIALKFGIVDILKAFADLNTLSDEEFWKRFEDNMTADSLELPVLDNVIYTLLANTLNGMSAADRQAVQTAMDNHAGLIENQTLTWVDGGATPKQLFDMFTQITPTTSGVPATIVNGTRAARLGQMHGVADKYLSMLESAQQS